MQRLSEWLYRQLLRLYPAAYQRDYAAEMHWVFAQMMQQTRPKGIRAVLVWWGVVLWDTLTNAVKEHQAERRGLFGQVITSQEPRYSLRQWAWLLALLSLLLVAEVFIPTWGTSNVYGCLLLVGMAHWGLSRLGWIAYNPLWGAYTLGIGIGIFALVMSVLMLQVPQGLGQMGASSQVQILAAAGLYGVVLLAVGAMLPVGRRAYGLFALSLIALIGVQGVLPAQPSLASWISALSTQLAVMITLGLCLFLLPYRGQQSTLIIFFLALGVQLVIVDPAYFTGLWARWMNPIILLIPALLSPVWWALMPNVTLRRRGIVLLWALFTLFNGVVPLFGRASQRAALGSYGLESPAEMLQWGARMLPFLLSIVLMMWLFRAQKPTTESALSPAAV